MAIESLFRAEIMTNFIYPFFLMFFILFAILEKTKILGDGQKQINALVSLVVSLVFVAAVLPKFIVGNLILIMTILIILAFVILLIWGFIGGKVEINNKFSVTIVVIVALILIGYVLSAAGLFGPLGGTLGDIFDWLFRSSWSSGFWENAIFIIIVAGIVAFFLKSKS